MLLINSLMIFKLKLLRPGPEATLDSETCDPQLGQLQSAPGEAPSRLTALPKGLEAAWAGGQRGSWLTFASDPKPRLQTPYSILFFPSIPSPSKSYRPAIQKPLYLHRKGATWQTRSGVSQPCKQKRRRDGLRIRSSAQGFWFTRW